MQNTVFCGHGLLAGMQIDDCQAPVPQTDAIGNIYTTSIRTAMDHGVIHALQQVLSDGFTIKVVNSTDTAHGQ
jgi:hypothetical protein